MIDDIRKQIKLLSVPGATKEAIYAHLLQYGFKVEDITAAFQEPSTQPVQSEDTSARTINIIVTIGAILIGAGIFSFIASNWSGMADWAKVSIILLFIVLINFLGWILKERKGLEKSGRALYLLGNVIYGAGIFLIAQIFNIREGWPDGFMIWMLGSLLMGMLLEEYVLIYFAALVGFIAVVGHPFEIFDDPLSFYKFALTPLFLLVVSFVSTTYVAITVRKKISDDQKGYF